MTPPSVSVIVPVRDRAATIGPCLDSILGSDRPAGGIEIVVVDNGSTDATPRVLDRYGDSIVQIAESRTGPAAARNAGLRAARGGLIAFTDSDCVVERDWVRRIVAPLDDPSVGAAGGRILALEGASKLEHFGERIHDHHRAIDVFRPPYVITMNLAARRSALDRIGRFDERLLRYEDVDLAIRLAAAGYRIVYVHEAVVRHRNRSTLRALFAEGWLHGYHSAALRALHPAASSGPDRLAPPSTYSRDLPPIEERFYSLVFRTGKRLGRAASALRPVRPIES